MHTYRTLAMCVHVYTWRYYIASKETLKSASRSPQKSKNALLPSAAATPCASARAPAPARSCSATISASAPLDIEPSKSSRAAWQNIQHRYCSAHLH